MSTWRAGREDTAAGHSVQPTGHRGGQSDVDATAGGVFGRHLSEVARLCAERVAVVQGARELSWREFHAHAAGLAGELGRRGVGPGTRVGIDSPNRLEYLVVLFALFLLEAVPVNVNYRYRATELVPLLRDCAAGALVYAEELSEVVDEAWPNLPECSVRVRIPAAGGFAFETNVLAKKIPENPAVSWRGPAGPDEWLLYTGGTTGVPKAVIGSQRERLEVLRTIAAGHLGWTGPMLPDVATMVAFERDHGLEPVYLTPAPLMHGTGLYCALTSLVTGGTAVLTGSGSFDAAQLAELIGARRVSDLHVVGEAMTLPLVEVLDQAVAEGRPYDLSSLRRVQSSGAVWTAGTKRRLLAHADAVLTDMIAATEGGPFAISVSSRSAPPADVAAFVLGSSARVVREDGTDVRPGSSETGLLAVRTASGAHYLGEPAHTAATFRDIDGLRYVVPGDVATHAADGTVRLLGRGSSVINTGGEKVHTDEVETLLRDHPGVRDVVVVGVPDPRLGQVVGAVVVPAADPIGLTELGEHIGTRRSGYKKPRVIATVSEIRRLVSGKADLHWAREQLVQARAAGQGGVAVPTDRKGT